MTDMTTLLRKLDTFDAFPEAVALRERGYDLLRLRTGAAVTDVGCGGGRAVHELARHGAEASGVDPSDVMIEASRSRWPELTFHLAPAERLPYADASLDGYRADKVLHALDDPTAAIGEARRVLRPGGRAMLVGQDWDFVAVDADDHELTHRLVRTRAAAMPSPNIARGYGNLLRDNGFTDITIEVHVVRPSPETMLSTFEPVADEVPGAGEWLAEQTERIANGRFLATLPMFLAAGTRD